jgi:hypothetical protein
LARRIAFALREAIKEREESPPRNLMDQIAFLMEERKEKRRKRGRDG